MPIFLFPLFKASVELVYEVESIPIIGIYIFQVPFCPLWELRL